MTGGGSKKSRDTPCRASATVTPISPIVPGEAHRLRVVTATPTAARPRRTGGAPPSLGSLAISGVAASREGRGVLVPPDRRRDSTARPAPADRLVRRPLPALGLPWHFTSAAYSTGVPRLASSGPLSAPFQHCHRQPPLRGFRTSPQLPGMGVELRQAHLPEEHDSPRRADQRAGMLVEEPPTQAGLQHLVLLDLDLLRQAGEGAVELVAGE